MAPEQDDDDTPSDSGEPPRPTQVTLHVVSPPVLEGTYMSRLATWGQDPRLVHNGTFHGCSPRRVVAITPNHGCSQPRIVADVSLNSVPPDKGRIANESVLALVDRGVCPFTDKIRAIQGMAGGGNGDGDDSEGQVVVGVALVVNSKDQVIDMPAGRATVSDLEVSPVSVSSVHGKLLSDVAAWLQVTNRALHARPVEPMRAWIADPAEECATRAEAKGAVGVGGPHRLCPLHTRARAHARTHTRTQTHAGYSLGHCLLHAHIDIHTQGPH